MTMENNKKETRNLFEAVMRNDATAVQQALRNGAGVNCVFRCSRYYFYSTALLEACELGCDEIVRILLDAGANARRRGHLDGSSTSPILAACAENRLSTVEILINHDNSLLETGNKDGWTPLRVAVRCQHTSLVRLLLDRGANVHRTTITRGGRTYLMLACQSGNLDIVRLLLAADVDVEDRDEEQQTALHHGARQKHADFVQVLLDHKAIVDAKVEGTGMTALLIACDKSNLEIARLLLARDANARATSQYGTSALMIACQRNNLDMARLLLTAGVDLEARDDRGRTALHFAAENGSIEVLHELFFDYNANMFVIDQDGKTPFDLLRRQT